MNQYKVIFKDTKAIESTKIDSSNKAGLKIDHEDGKGIIRWLIVKAKDEEESLQKANEIALETGLQIKRTFAPTF